MEKRKSFELVVKWASDGIYIPYSARLFVDWLYKKGFTIETRFQGKDLEKQEELFEANTG